MRDDKREGSSIGETRKCPDTGIEFEVVWDGGPLLGPRPTKIIDPTWTAPKRLYNKKAKGEEVKPTGDNRVGPSTFDEQAADLEADFYVEDTDEN